MPAPQFSAFTEKMYRLFPANLRNLDTLHDYTVLRYMSLYGDQVQEVSDLLERFRFTEAGGTSELTDPDLVEAEWLTWLAQLVGAEIDGMTQQQRRDSIRTGSTGVNSGTQGALASAAQSELTGSKYVQIRPHQDSNGPATQWDVLLITREDETPSLPDVIDAVTTKGGKPAGVVLHYRKYSVDWDTLEALLPTWDDIDATGSWRVVEYTGS